MDEKGGYGDPVIFIPKRTPNLTARLIDENMVGLPENQDNFLNQYHNVKTENSKLCNRILELEEQLNKINLVSSGGETNK